MYKMCINDEIEEDSSELERHSGADLEQEADQQADQEVVDQVVADGDHSPGNAE